MEAFIVGPERFQANYLDGEVSASAEFEDYYFPVQWLTSGFGNANPLLLPVGTGRVGGAHYLQLLQGGLVQNHVTSHAFGNSSPSANDFVWYGFHHQVAEEVNNPSNTDDVAIVHFFDIITQTNQTWLAVTLEIAASGAPASFDSFEYQIQKVTSDGSANLTSADLNAAVKTSATYGKDTWQWVVVGVEYKGQDATTDKIYLYVDDVLIGSSFTASGENDWMSRGGYMSPDTRSITGKGSTTMQTLLSDMVSNDDKGNGLITRPGASASAPFYRAPAPRIGVA